MATTIFDAVRPREDVLAGTITDSTFAANLDEVVSGTAPAIYGDAATFFAATHPSANLRTLLTEAAGRLSGKKPDAPPIIRLETNLGGGKTHNLIALYHLAQGRLDKAHAKEFVDPKLLPSSPIRLAVFVGTTGGATSFPEADGIRPRTLWGHLALQLGGTAAYEKIRADDESLQAVGADTFKDIFGDGANLILLDELARYLVVARGVAVGGTTLDRLTVAFLMALLEAVDSRPRTVLVLTTTEVTDAFGDATEQVLGSIREAQALVSRREHVLRPAAEEDLPRILERRLFASIDRAGASQVAAAYAKAAGDALARGSELPDAMSGPLWSAAIERSYPFHPALIQVLDRRLSTMPNFHRVRGALRLLARTVRGMWIARPEGALLIHPFHIDLADQGTREELTSRVERPLWEPIIRQDIAARPEEGASHADSVDRRMGTPYARRLATVAYLNSLTTDVPGVPAGHLVGAVLAPGDDAAIVTKALDALENSAWYLHVDARGYRFSTEPSLVRLIQEAESRLALTKVKDTATEILARQFKDSALKVRRSWEDSKVPDRADDAWLVVLHWDEFGADHGVRTDGPAGVATPSEAVPDRVRDIWERTPSGGLREFRNRIVFLAPSGVEHERMLAAVRHHLALNALVDAGDVIATLPDEKRRDLRDRARASELEARIAVCNHVNLLFVPRANGLERIALDQVTQASVKPNQTDAVLERLAAMDKTLAAGDKPLDPGFVRAKLGAQLAAPMSTAALVQTFARRSDLPMVLDRQQLVGLVLAGVRNGVWEYQDPERGEDGWATADRPTAAVRLADDTFLHPAGSAPRPTALPCPLCGKVHTGACERAIAEPVPGPRDIETRGSAGVAVQSARERAGEAGARSVAAITLSIEPLGSATATQLARLHSVVPADTAGARLRYVVSVRVAFGTPDDVLSVEFSGTPVDFQPIKNALESVLRGREATLRASVVATFDPAIPIDGEAFEQIRRRATETGPDQCTVRVGAGEAR